MTEGRMSEQKIEPLRALIRLNEQNNAQYLRFTAEIARLEQEKARLRFALIAVTEEYCQLANSGDAGFWNPEEVPSVILARAALNITSQKGGTNEK